jgi:GTPase SAR1 family protein
MASRNTREYRLNKTPVVFKTLENAQNVEAIAKIFAKDKPNYELRPNPHLVIVVGSPGVGKTTKSAEIIKKQLGLNYDDFYNISLDSLVERVEPYRRVTKNLYNTLKRKKINLGQDELNEKNFGLLSEVYLPTIMSNKINFSLGQTEESKLAKIRAIGNEDALDALKKKKAPPKVPKSGLKSLRDMRLHGLQYGIMNGFNILYDTTLTSSTNIIKRDIMPVLEMNKEVKYKITVILVTAKVENVQNRIKGRHNKMLAETDPYIRAINPNLTFIFIKDNKEGFDIAEDYFKSTAYKTEVPSTFYNADNFKFIEVENPPLRNNTRKNNNNNNNSSSIGSINSNIVRMFNNL